MKIVKRWTGSIGALILGLFLVAPLSAQGVGVTLVGETAGDDVSLLLAEGSWHAGGLGLKPVAALQTYLVTHDAGTSTVNTWSVNPMAGLRYQVPGGFAQGQVGYAIKGDDEDGAVPFYGGAEDGVTATGHVEWWGQGSFGAQGIVAHNFGAEYLWSRLRGTVRVIASPSGDFHAGLEGGWQGDTSSGEIVNGVSVPTYSATMVGPLVKWGGNNVTGVLGAGWKQIEEGFVPEDEESTWYGRVELVFTPRW